MKQGRSYKPLIAKTSTFEVAELAIQQLANKFKLIKKSVGSDLDGMAFCDSSNLKQMKFFMVRHCRLSTIINILEGSERKEDYTKSYIKELNNTAKLELKYSTSSL